MASPSGAECNFLQLLHSLGYRQPVLGLQSIDGTNILRSVVSSLRSCNSLALALTSSELDEYHQQRQRHDENGEEAKTNERILASLLTEIDTRRDAVDALNQQSKIMETRTEALRQRRKHLESQSEAVADASSHCDRAEVQLRKTLIDLNETLRFVATGAKSMLKRARACDDMRRDGAVEENPLMIALESQLLDFLRLEETHLNELRRYANTYCSRNSSLPWGGREGGAMQWHLRAAGLDRPRWLQDFDTTRLARTGPSPSISSPEISSSSSFRDLEETRDTWTTDNSKSSSFGKHCLELERLRRGRVQLERELLSARLELSRSRAVRDFLSLSSPSLSKPRLGTAKEEDKSMRVEGIPMHCGGIDDDMAVPRDTSYLRATEDDDLELGEGPSSDNLPSPLLRDVTSYSQELAAVKLALRRACCVEESQDTGASRRIHTSLPMLAEEASRLEATSILIGNHSAKAARHASLSKHQNVLLRGLLRGQLRCGLVLTMLEDETRVIQRVADGLRDGLAAEIKSEANAAAKRCAVLSSSNQQRNEREEQEIDATLSKRSMQHGGVSAHSSLRPEDTVFLHLFETMESSLPVGDNFERNYGNFSDDDDDDDAAKVQVLCNRGLNCHTDKGTHEIDLKVNSPKLQLPGSSGRLFQTRNAKGSSRKGGWIHNGRPSVGRVLDVSTAFASAAEAKLSSNMTAIFPEKIAWRRQMEDLLMAYKKLGEVLTTDSSYRSPVTSNKLKDVSL